MRVLASALTLLALGSPPKIAYLNGSTLHVGGRVAATHVSGAVRWSGDARLLSVGGRVVGGPRLANGDLEWAPEGETAAYMTSAGALRTWSPGTGSRLVVRASWGARSFAWGPDGRLAIARYVCHAPCGIPQHQEVWTARNGSLRRVAGPLRGVWLPIVRGFGPGGRVLWWPDEQGSGSIAADGLELYANRRPIAETLVYDDYVTPCGGRIALAAGGDRYAMHGKRLLLDGRDLSHDTSRSWVSPACSADGRTVVAAASRNTTPPRIGVEHRALWQLLPARRRLTAPPAGLSDENPRVLADGSILFVRTRSEATALRLFGSGTIEWLHDGVLTPLGTASGADNYYGHYDWPDLVAVAP